MFIENKYTKWYNSIVALGLVDRPDLRTERHHIIPESFFKNRTRKGPPGWLDGNPDEPSNFTYLTVREHFICHRLLIKMLTERSKAKMVHALSMMLANNQNQNRNYKITSRTYETLRIQLSNIMKEKWTDEARAIRSDLMKGEHNHFYGKHHTDTTKEFLSNRIVSEETRELISITQKERFKDRPGTFLGKHHSKETKEKIRQAKTGTKDSVETRVKKSNAGKSRPPVSTETRIKLSTANKGKPGLIGEKNGFYGKRHTAEQRAKKSQEKLASPKKICYHCNKEVDAMNYGRWHGDRCKSKK